MRILLDENVDRLLKPHFRPDFQVWTVPEQGWAGMGDADILRRADQQFDALVTMDQNLPHQQNLSAFTLRVLVLKAKSNAFRDVVALMPKVNDELQQMAAGEVTVVSLP